MELKKSKNLIEREHKLRYIFAKGISEQMYLWRVNL